MGSAARIRRTVSSAVVTAQRIFGSGSAKGQARFSCSWRVALSKRLEFSLRIRTNRTRSLANEPRRMLPHRQPWASRLPQPGRTASVFLTNPVPRSAELHPKLRPWTVAATKTLRTTCAPTPPPRDERDVSIRTPPPPRGIRTRADARLRKPLPFHTSHLRDERAQVPRFREREPG